MARPTRQGVDYFPLDIHLDDKFKFIQIKYGLEGFAVIIKLLQNVYANGYWYKWEEDEQLIFSHENNIEVERLELIVSESLERDIFNKELFKKHNILTSSGIQKRYKEIVKRRKDVEVVVEYLLVDNNFGVNGGTDDTKCIHDVSIENTSSGHDEGKSTQSKVNKSRVKEIKEDNPMHIEIFNHWIEQNIIIHKEITTRITKAMDKALREFTLDEIIESISTYGQAYHSEFYFSHKYTLEKFLKQNNGVADWIEEGSMYENYKDYLSKGDGIGKHKSNATGSNKEGEEVDWAEQAGVQSF